MQLNKTFGIALISILFLAICSMSTTGIIATSNSAMTAQDSSVSARASINVNLTPMLDGEEYEGQLIVFVHDLSTTPSTRVLIENLSVLGEIEFEIGLVPIQSEIQDSSEVMSSSYLPSSVYIHVTDEKGSVAGGVAFIFDFATIEGAIPVLVNLTRLVDVDPSEANGYLSSRSVNEDSLLDVADETVYATNWTKSGEIHSISNITVQWNAEAEGADQTIIYFQSYEKTITYNNYCIPPCVYETSWTTCGKMPALCTTDCDVQVSGNGCYEVETWLTYKCEYWYFGPDIGNPYIEQEYYFMTPSNFDAARLGGVITCNDANYGTYHCSASHPSYAASRSGGDTFDLSYYEDVDDTTQWKVSEVQLSFGFSGKTMTFGIGIGITLFRAAGGAYGNTPWLTVTFTSGTLYYWHHNNDPTQYVRHFSWS
ncbi:MAG TPA: hypothetical protein P5290_02510 [Candidatus Methanomethylicus sp.]|nr:hypothetical protein [Candidatus Methanomethylicus sp.]